MKRYFGMHPCGIYSNKTLENGHYPVCYTEFVLFIGY